MTDTDQEREDEVLRRMLKTPPKPHKAKGKRRTLRVGDPRDPAQVARALSERYRKPPE